MYVCVCVRGDMFIYKWKSLSSLQSINIITKEKDILNDCPYLVIPSTIYDGLHSLIHHWLARPALLEATRGQLEAEFKPPTV